MKLFSILFLAAFASTSPASASVIKTTTIDGQEYKCRPSNIETPCNLQTDFGFMMSLAADSADAMLCLNEVGSSQIKVKACFLQRRVKKYAKDLDVQMSGRGCWDIFISKCIENSACPKPEDPLKRCGHLGVFLNSIREAGLNNHFNESDGVTLCKSLVVQ